MSAIKLDKLDGDTLLCPNCGEDYLHQESVVVLVRDREDGPATRVEVKASPSELQPWIAARQGIDVLPPLEHPAAEVRVSRAAHPPGRRDSIAITFFCEHCPAKPVLVIAQHKGMTLVTWGDQ